MSKVRIEAFVSVPPCSGGVAVKRLLKEIEAEFGDRVEIVFHTGPGDKEWDEYAIGNAPAMVIGDLVKFVGLAPSKESLVGALREAGLAQSCHCTETLSNRQLVSEGGHCPTPPHSILDTFRPDR